MFEHMEIAEYVYGCVIETTTKNQLGHTPTMMIKSVKQEEETPLSKTNFGMGRAFKRKTRYVARLEGDLPPTCMIHDKGNP